MSKLRQERQVYSYMSKTQISSARSGVFEQRSRWRRPSHVSSDGAWLWVDRVSYKHGAPPVLPNRIGRISPL